MHTCNCFPYPSPHTRARTCTAGHCPVRNAGTPVSRDSPVTCLTRQALPAAPAPACSPPHRTPPRAWCSRSPVAAHLQTPGRSPGAAATCFLVVRWGWSLPAQSLPALQGAGGFPGSLPGGRWSSLPLLGQETTPLNETWRAGLGLASVGLSPCADSPSSVSAPPAHPAAAAHQGAEAAAAEALPGLLAVLGADGVRRGGLR